MKQQEILIKKSKRQVYKKGRWSNDQQSLFEQGLQIYGRDWRKVQNYIKSRTLAQVRSHAQKYFLRLQKINIVEQELQSKQLRVIKKSNFEHSKVIKQQERNYNQNIKIEAQKISEGKNMLTSSTLYQSLYNIPYPSNPLNFSSIQPYQQFQQFPLPPSNFPLSLQLNSSICNKFPYLPYFIQPPMIYSPFGASQFLNWK